MFYYNKSYPFCIFPNNYIFIKKSWDIFIFLYIITYKTNFFTRKYKVDNIQTILETDWNLLKETDQNKLTLITCIANKKLQRLCVQATEIVENNLK